ncbi:MAG: NAD(P)/FAD-dependent oxidoreductase [Patescibacteria group bacterium]|jgi:hypothetical protein
MEYDIVIIGGGPAGMMAAGRAGERGARTLLVEKNKSLGVKLLITGHGRCNITNNQYGPKEFISRFGKNGKFLFSSLYRFGTADAIDFFQSRGVKTKVEAGGKIFPQSDRSQDVLNALAGYLKESGVEIKTGVEVKKIVRAGDVIRKIILADGTEIKAQNYIIATGGLAYPQTGSTGDGYKWARELGHAIVEPLPALTTIILKDRFIKDLRGLSFSGVKATSVRLNKKIHSIGGDIIFTDDGIGGPAIMNLTRLITRENPGGISLAIDFFPDRDISELDCLLRDEFKKEPNKLLKNILHKFMPPRLAAVILKIAEIDGEKKVNAAAKDERKKLTRALKEFRLTIKCLSGFSRAYITSGGVALNEVDPATMRSKLIHNLYFAGEVLNLDGPTGGNNLQVAWTTGFAAGTAAAGALNKDLV